MKILLICSVDDLVNVMSVYLTTYLQSEYSGGYTFRVARSRAEAQEVLESPAHRDGFDLIIVDQTLPDGLGSDFIAKFCTREGGDTPHILMSGRVGYRHDNLLVKPFRRDQLLAMIEKRTPKQVKPAELPALEN